MALVKTISIESSPAYAKLRLSKFKGIKRQNFILHLKECEFRFNNRDKKGAELYKILLKMIRENPLRLIDSFRIPISSLLAHSLKTRL